MRMQQLETANDAARKIVRLFGGVLPTESERLEAYRLILDLLIEAVELYQFKMEQEAKRLSPIPTAEGR